jgi:hypothetical protein
MICLPKWQHTGPQEPNLCYNEQYLDQIYPRNTKRNVSAFSQTQGRRREVVVRTTRVSAMDLAKTNHRCCWMRNSGVILPHRRHSKSATQGWAVSSGSMMHAHGLFRPADVYEPKTLSRISQSKRCCIPFKPEIATNFTRNTSAGFINGHMEDPELEDPELNGPQVSPTRDIEPRVGELEQATTATTAAISQLPPVERNGKRSGNIFSYTRIYRSARLREDQRVSIGNLWLKRSACG